MDMEIAKLTTGDIFSSYYNRQNNPTGFKVPIDERKVYPNTIRDMAIFLMVINLIPPTVVTDGLFDLLRTFYKQITFLACVCHPIFEGGKKVSVMSRRQQCDLIYVELLSSPYMRNRTGN